MPSLILSHDTVNVNITSRHLELKKRIEPEVGDIEYEKMTVPLVDVDRVIICGRPCISMPTLQRLMIMGIPTFFITAKGKWIGSLSPDNNMNATRRIKQYEFSGDKYFSLMISRKLLFAKIRNSRRVLQRLAANREISHYNDHVKAMETLKNISTAIQTVDTLDELRGYEGLAAATYFAQLGNYFPKNIPFKGRNRRPPKDAANALMSWTYAIVQGEIDGVIRSHGLDACIGYLHSISHGSPSLALDLLEPLRAPCCDMLVLNILNHKYLHDEDFEYHDDDGGTYLKPESRVEFFKNYETTMTRKFTPYKGDSHTDFRAVIKESVLNILRAMEGSDAFDFFLMP